MVQVLQYLVQCVNTTMNELRAVSGSLLLVLAISFPCALVWQICETAARAKKKREKKAKRRMRRLTK